ncbi:MAG: arylsulfatase [Bryobacterales bacterium]|nr:arylsulfatase [Bryobacterales bacterium]
MPESTSTPFRTALDRRGFLAKSAGGIGSLLGCARTARDGAPEGPTNIVFIMADDLGFGELGCYGQQRIRTPRIDRMAAEGMKFAYAYSGCSVCAPARSVLMTGMHMGHTSVRSNPGGVPILAGDTTVAELLKEQGYATGCFGKWGLGDIGTDGVPWKQGFDEFVGYLHQAHAHYFYPLYIYDNDKRLQLEGNEGDGRGTYSHDVIADRALEFIERNRDRPFFCYVPFTIPHAEYVAPDDEIYAAYRGQFEEVELGENPNRPGRLIRPEEPHATLAAMITRLDRDVGRILDRIASLGLDGSTIVFFTSDNGAAAATWTDYFNSSGPLRGSKRDFYEGGIRVPMLARWPGRIEEGSQSDLVWGFHDFLPTAVELAGGPPPEPTDGISVVPTLLGGGNQTLHKYLYWELPRHIGATGDFRDETPAQALRMGTWKAVRPEPDGELELYDLGEDPGEMRNLANEHPDVLAEMERRLTEARTPPRNQTQPDHIWWERKG